MVLKYLFFFISAILIISSIMVILVVNSMYSVLFLILSFILSACLLFLLEFEFIALLFIIIYVGAVAVLFLFVVMMLDIKTTNTTKNSLKYFPFSIFIGGVFLIEIFLIVLKNFRNNVYNNSILFNYYKNWYDEIDYITEINAVAQIIYTHYVLQFLLAGLILFIAVIGSVVLTVNFSYQKFKNQIYFKQLSRSFKNSIIIIKKAINDK